MQTPQPFYFLHGWATNGNIFNTLRAQLPSNWLIHCPDLAGHGTADSPPQFNIIEQADKIAEQLPNQTNLLGWSLGGLIALHIAHRHPEKVHKLCLSASFAKLLATPDYSAGLKQITLNKMVDLFQQDYPKFMRQFLELQLTHTPDREQIINNLLPVITQTGTPKALKSALDALSQDDARECLPQITAPTLLIFGNKDTITPVRMGEYLAQHIPHTKLHLIDKAAHIPFVSHTELFAQYLIDFFSDSLSPNP